ncbi:putative membrane protein [Thalassobacillus cyri]|uniref:Putative membrane protein n=1 Tax=Thalassobacillus cyri TaxID=571932 RepID=A0A1H3ZRY4_9BACI|nr:cytochrome c oxidase assembly protein [Thalassobacillus cyri]SEA26459.1 putative membrane protein [Thalassobacillus cyri]
MNNTIVAFVLGVPFVLLFGFYMLAVYLSNHHRRWPLYRSVLWTAGVSFSILSVAGPIAERAHTDFTAHMLGHLFLGMLAPLLMALAAPMSLLLRTLPVKGARRLTRLLRSKPVGVLSNPVTATILNIGGLWLLYTTDLYMMMHHSIILHVFIHIHVFLAGYLFTISMIYIDPIPHRFSYRYRAIVLVIALAGHGILSKFIYANPPSGVPADQAQAGSRLMYYGGDMIDVVIIFLLFLYWYQAARPRKRAAQVT